MIDEKMVKNIIENLLFVAKKPVSLQEFEKIVPLEKEQLKKCIAELEQAYQDRGLQILSLANGYQLCTRVEYAEYIQKFLSSPIEYTLSHAALEVLAIIAYKQPVTGVEVEKIRGVISDSSINTLIERGLVKEAGRTDGVGRPYLYSTTENFLRHFGLSSITDLPALPEGPVSSFTFSNFTSKLEEIELQEEARLV